MTEVLTSVQRLCALARVGSVRIDRTTLESFDAQTAQVPAEAKTDVVRNSVAILLEVLAEHGIARIDVDSTATDTEFVKLGGLLSLDQNATAHTPDHSLRDAVRDLGLWNVRIWFDGDTMPVIGTRHPSGGGGTAGDATAGAAGSANTSGERSAPLAKQQAEETARARGAAVAAVESGELSRAIEDQDAATVCRILYDTIGTSAFSVAATEPALHLVVDALVTEQYAYDGAVSILEHAGVPGARAVFAQLMAASDAHERRMLFDLGKGLACMVVVARENAGKPSWYAVRNAATFLGGSKEAAVIDDLSRLLKHADTRVRVAAVAALGKIGGQAATARLESVLFDPSPDVRNQALSMVFAPPDSDAGSQAVRVVLDGELSLEYQLEMITALAQVRTTRARKRLETLSMQDGQTLDVLQVRLAAVGALAEGHRPAADGFLHQLRNDASALVRDRVHAILG